MSVGSWFSQYGSLVSGIIATLVAAGIALFWSKYPIRWLLAIATIALGAYIFGLYKMPGDIDPDLDFLFRRFYRGWLFVLGVLALYSITHLVVTLVRFYYGSPTGDGSEGPCSDIENAWQEILIQLSRSGIDPAVQDLYLLIAPEESLAASLVNAAGLQFFANPAPASAEAPIHCYAVSDALFVSCSGASNLGRQDAMGTTRLEFLCRLIETLNPERPILRGIAVLLPFEWAQAGPNALRQAAAIREDLQIIRRTLKVRCPTLTVCSLQDSIPGFNDFTSRLPANLRQQRCGFSVPISQGTEGAVIRRGMVWMTRWFQVWSLNLMVADIDNKEGNGRLLSMNAVLRGGREALVRLLESGLMVLQQDEPILYRGCYFAASGSSAESHAFAAGLLNGARKGRLLADRELTTWSRESNLQDRNYRRWAYGLGIVSVVLTVLIWWLAIVPKLSGPAGASYEWVGWLGLIALGLVWVGGLFGSKIRRKKPA